MTPNEKVSKPRPLDIETLLLRARHIFRVLALLDQLHSLDETDNEALSSLAVIGQSYIEQIEALIYPES